jgi:hypothetical protein
MNLPHETISLEGVLLQASKEIEGSPESTLSVTKSPVIFRPMPSTMDTKLGLTSSSTPHYIFRQVNFTSTDLHGLFILQNLESDIKILFEDCHFLDERYFAKDIVI